MHHIFRIAIAAIGGILFIIIGIARMREQKRLRLAGKKTEGSMLWSIFVVAGAGLLVFAIGIMIYQLNHG